MSYLLIRVHSFECDEPGCPAEEEYPEPTKAAAIRMVLGDGWERAGTDRFFCPEHAMPAASIPNRQDGP